MNFTRYGEIYIITNSINDKVYVGLTTNSIKYRFLKHGQGKRTNCPIKNAIRLYGKNNFKVKSIYTSFSKKDLTEKEQYFIKFYNSKHNK